MIDAFSPTPPPWIERATHAPQFRCPLCHKLAQQAKAVWINRRSPLYGEDRQRKWQEFYWCVCDGAWWAWNSDRPPSRLSAKRSPD